MVVDFLTMSGTIVERKSEDRPLEKSPKYMLNIFCNRPTILQNVHTRINLCFELLNKETYSRKYQRRFQKLKLGQSRFDWGKVSLKIQNLA